MLAGPVAPQGSPASAGPIRAGDFSIHTCRNEEAQQSTDTGFAAGMRIKTMKFARNIEAIKADGHLSLELEDCSVAIRYTLEVETDCDGNPLNTATLNQDDLRELYAHDQVSIGRAEKGDFELYLAQTAEAE